MALFLISNTMVDLDRNSFELRSFESSFWISKSQAQIFGISGKIQKFRYLADDYHKFSLLCMYYFP